MRSAQTPTGPLSYEIRRSGRARRSVITVYPSGRTVLTVPASSKQNAEEFFQKHLAWVMRARSRLLGKIRLPGGKERYKINKESARKFAEARLERYNGFYKFRYCAVRIRDMRSRWGSCTKSGNLTFSYKILYLPEDIADYIIVHELCHLKEFNHSPAFWRLVALAQPEYKRLRKRLKAYVH